jgi:hypothetical protein
VRYLAERYLMGRADQAAVEQANVSNDIFSAMAKISFKV